MKKFMFNNPVEYIYGKDTLTFIGELAKKCGVKACIVTYNQEYFINLAKKIQSLLMKENITSIIYSDVEANPTTITAINGSHLALENHCDLLIGIGGGSALDTTKGIAHCMKHGDDITNYMYGKKIGHHAMPFILIPTTSGTGSEGNNFAVFTNPENSDKKGLISHALYAKYALLDPILLQTLPKKVIAGPGLDALFHCIEAYTSKTCTPAVEIYALEGIRLVGENLEKMYHSTNDINVLQNMQMASLLGGICIGLSGLGIPHALDHPIGGLYNIVHSEGLAAIYPACLNFTIPHAPEKFRQIATALKKDISNKSLSEQAELGKIAILELMQRVEMTPTLSDLNVKKQDIEWIINNTKTVMGIALTNSVGNPSDQDLYKIIMESF